MNNDRSNFDEAVQEQLQALKILKTYPEWKVYENLLHHLLIDLKERCVKGTKDDFEANQARVYATEYILSLHAHLEQWVKLYGHRREKYGSSVK